jgi:hypothetical protein
MKTIEIRPETLIKFIPSPADGDRIPGAVLRVEDPILERVNEFEFCLSYLAHSKLSASYAECRLDEELEVVRNSNRLLERRPQSKISGLIQIDGTAFRFDSSNRAAVWTDCVCAIPNPFNAIGPHAISAFVRWNRNHVASLVRSSGALALAVVADNYHAHTANIGVDRCTNRVAGTPCLHNEGLLLPWSSADGGTRIEWLDTADVSRLVDGSTKIGGCEE